MRGCALCNDALCSVVHVPGMGVEQRGVARFSNGAAWQMRSYALPGVRRTALPFVS